MKATVPYIEEKFNEYNALMFGGKLERVPIELSKSASYVGQCSFRTRRIAGIIIGRSDLRLKISTRHDLPEEEIQDTIIHEMIHCYIWQQKIKDTSTHGKVFRSMMAQINRDFGRHITISHRLTAEQREEGLDKREKPHLVALVTFRDGREGVKLLPLSAPKIRAYDKVLRKHGNASDIQYYYLKSAWFNRFPTSTAYNVFFADMSEVRSHLEGVSPIPLAELVGQMPG